MVIALYYSDHWGAKSLPMLSTGIFTEAGNTWNQKLVFGSVNPHLNVEALERYGLPRMTASYIWANMCQCLAVSRPHSLDFQVCAIADIFELADRGSDRARRPFLGRRYEEGLEGVARQDCPGSTLGWVFLLYMEEPSLMDAFFAP